MPCGGSNAKWYVMWFKQNFSKKMGYVDQYAKVLDKLHV